jgi:predicted regulator of Ras-like GTPase activity (Roadblock/LC7/MglB family)
MLNHMPPGQPSGDLAWLLGNFASQVPYTRSALLASTDGVSKYFHGLDTDQADRLAAIASGLFSLARGAGAHFGGGPGVLQVNAELEDTLLFVSAAGPGTVLAVLASREADAGLIGYEMGQLAKRVPSYLATPARRGPVPPGDATR